MRRAVIAERQRAELVDAATPRPVENWALVEVHVTPMCTEYKAWNAGGRHEYLGHEAAGVVAEVAQPCRVKPGDRVVVMPLYPCGKCALCVAGDYIHCEQMHDFAAFTGSPEGQATYAQYLLKPDWLLPAIPEDISTEMASLALCALGPTFGAFDRMGVSAFDKVLIAGLGPVGLGGVVNASFRGARVAAVDSVPYRVERALQLGAEAVFDPTDPDVARRVREWSGGAGVDCSVDCAGSTAAQRLCLECTRRRGSMAFVGECGEDLTLRASPDLIRKGLTLVGSWHYNLNLFPRILEVIRRSPVAANLVSHRLPMSRVQEAFALSASHQTAKILLDPRQ